MNKKFISFTDVVQYRNIVKNVCRHAQYKGKDSNGEAIIDLTVRKPIIPFIGTIKLHGTNAGVSYNSEHGLWYQSRKNIITLEKDNAGFAFFASDRTIVFRDLIEIVRKHNNLKYDNIITIFGEWCGQGIQKGVALNKLEKMFVIFAVKITPFDDDITPYYVYPYELRSSKDKIYNSWDFKKYFIDIDFEKPELSQNKMVDIVNEVEKECPVGKAFGSIGVGEGVVWSCWFNGIYHAFKTKGEKHSISKVKKIASVDTEKINSIIKFVDYAVTENRLNQGIEQIFIIQSIEPDIKKMGGFLKWIMSDIIKEESDTLTDNNLEPKQIGKYVSNRARVWFMKYLGNVKS